MLLSHAWAHSFSYSSSSQSLKASIQYMFITCLSCATCLSVFKSWKVSNYKIKSDCQNKHLLQDMLHHHATTHYSNTYLVLVSNSSDWLLNKNSSATMLLVSSYPCIKKLAATQPRRYQCWASQRIIKCSLVLSPNLPSWPHLHNPGHVAAS